VHVGDTLSQVAPQAIADAAFIAAARQDVPALLAEIDALRRQLAECQAQAEEAQRESYRRGADADRAVADARRERDAARAEAVELRRQLATCQELRLAELALGTQSDAVLERAISEAAELRRQLAAMTIRYEAMRRSEDVATLRWGEAWADADDLRRQLAEAQAEIARLRDEAALLRGDTA